MGFFSSLWNGIKSVAKAVVKTVTAPLWAPLVVGEKVVNALTSSKTDSNSSVRQVDHTAERLSEMCEPLMKQAREAEDQCKRYIEAFFDEYDSKFLNEPNMQGYNLDRLRSRKNWIVQDIDGTITRRISRALSLDDNQTLQILKIDNYSERQRLMRKRFDDVQIDVRDTIAKDVRDGLRKLSEDIEQHMSWKVDEKERNVKHQEELFAAWERDFERQTFDRDRAKLVPAEKLFALQLIEQELDSLQKEVGA